MIECITEGRKEGREENEKKRARIGRKKRGAGVEEGRGRGGGGIR